MEYLELNLEHFWSSISNVCLMETYFSEDFEFVGT